MEVSFHVAMESSFHVAMVVSFHVAMECGLLISKYKNHWELLIKK